MKTMKKLLCLMLSAVLLFSIPNGFAASWIPGDVNGDGHVGADDARLALRRSIDLETYKAGTRAFLSSDLDSDGIVTAGEARQILRVSVGLERFVSVGELLKRWLNADGKRYNKDWQCFTGRYKNAVFSFMYTPGDTVSPYSITMLTLDGDPQRLGILKFSGDFTRCCMNLEVSKEGTTFLKALYSVDQANFTKNAGASLLTQLQYESYDRMTADAKELAASMVSLMLSWTEQIFVNKTVGVHVREDFNFPKFK